MRFQSNDPIKSVIAFTVEFLLIFLRITIDTGSVSVLQFDNESCEISKINIIGDFQAYWERHENCHIRIINKLFVGKWSCHNMERLISALTRMDHQVIFFEKDVDYYAGNRDFERCNGLTLILYEKWIR